MNVGKRGQIDNFGFREQASVELGESLRSFSGTLIYQTGTIHEAIE